MNYLCKQDETKKSQQSMVLAQREAGTLFGFTWSYLCSTFFLFSVFLLSVLFYEKPGKPEVSAVLECRTGAKKMPSKICQMLNSKSRMVVQGSNMDFSTEVKFCWNLTANFRFACGKRWKGQKTMQYHKVYSPKKSSKYESNSLQTNLNEEKKIDISCHKHSL